MVDIMFYQVSGSPIGGPLVWPGEVLSVSAIGLNLSPQLFCLIGIRMSNGLRLMLYQKYDGRVIVYLLGIPFCRSYILKRVELQ